MSEPPYSHQLFECEHHEMENRRANDITIAGDYHHDARNNGFVARRFWYREKERIIAKFSRPRPGDHVLDLGCGSGVISNYLASFGASVIGVDANPMAIDYARQTFAQSGLDFQLGRVEHLGFAP